MALPVQRSFSEGLAPFPKQGDGSSFFLTSIFPQAALGLLQKQVVLWVLAALLSRVPRPCSTTLCHPPSSIICVP